MRRILDFVILNEFKYYVKKNEDTVFFEITPGLELSITSPENGSHSLFFHKVVIRNYHLENQLILETNKQDEVLEKVIKFLKYPHLLKKELKNLLGEFRKVENQGEKV